MKLHAPSFLLGSALTLLVFGAAARVRSQQPPAQTQRFPQFENEAVRVWRSIILPHAPLTLHRHDHPRVLVALRGGNMQVVDDHGATEQHPWETGKAYWLPTNPPGTQHADVNTGSEPIEVIVVELKKEK